MKRPTPNVVWITLESVRARNTSINGYERDTTPNLRHIAGDTEGVSFRRCFSQSIWTPASSASILTGTYLFEHRVGYDGKAKEQLPIELSTLPELLSRAGYRTACLTPNSYLSDATGLDRGFDRYRWLSLTELHRSPETLWPLLKYIIRSGTYGHGFSFNGDKHNMTYIMLQILKRWTRSFARADAPFFLYIHCPNPHLPYTPPQKYIDKFTDDIDVSGEEALRLSLKTYANRDRMIEQMANGLPFTADEWMALKAMYDAEIAYADEFVGRLFNHVQELGGGETVFVITGDHGELFGEYGLLGHNLILHDSVTNVPMVVHGVDGLEHAKDTPIGHVDMTRTLAELLGIEDAQFQGTDLTTTAPDHVLSQRGIPHFDEYLEANPEFDFSRFHESPVSALRTEDYKYLKSESKTELFALPDEETNVRNNLPEVAEELDSTLRTELEQLVSWDDSAAQADYTDAMKEQLSDLGYL